MAGRPNNFKKPPPKQREYLNGGGRKPKACLQPKDQLPQQKIKKAPFPILSLPLEVIHGQILHWLNRMKDVGVFFLLSHHLFRFIVFFQNFTIQSRRFYFFEKNLNVNLKKFRFSSFLLILSFLFFLFSNLTYVLLSCLCSCFKTMSRALFK